MYIYLFTKGENCMTLIKAINIRIVELCAQKDISPCELMKKAHIPESTFKSIVSGKSQNPSIVNIQKISIGLDVSITEFFNSKLFDSFE